ncbi:PAS domain-containing protein, partial [bacterium]|nr:PAS domain-containing protein [bacterium]
VGTLSEITARKQAEEALHSSVESLREAQTIGGLGSYVLDIPKGLWNSSDVLDLLFGIGPQYERSVAGWIALIHVDDRQMMADYLNEVVLARGQPFNKEYRVVRQNDQAVRWVHGKGRLDFDAKGRPVRMSGTIQDITDRVQGLQVIENLLRDQKAILDSAIVGFMKVRDRKIIWVNEEL